MRNLILAICMILVFSATAVAAWTEQAKINAPTPTPNSLFGISISIDGDYAIVGESDANNLTGAAYIFKRDGVNWLYQATLTAADGASNDRFGASVAISGDYAIVGATGDDDAAVSAGCAFIFVRSGVLWAQQAKLIDPGGVNYDGFGISVSIDGAYAIVGASGDASYAGAAYIFKRNGTSWLPHLAKLTASDGASSDLFGTSVSISGSHALVGARSHNSFVGAAYIFKKPAFSEWVNATEQAKFTPSDGSASVRDLFGTSVGIDGDYAIVGAPKNGGNGQGAAYIFEKQFPGWVTTTETAKLVASDNDMYDELGGSVSISGVHAIAGAMFDNQKGAAYIFKRDVNWSEEQKLTASDGDNDDWFGTSVSIDGHYAIIGAFNDELNPPIYDAGSAYIFHLPGDCNCGAKGDVNNDDSTDPLDVTYLVNYVYLSLDALAERPDCPFPKGDMNCDESADPLDVTYLVNYVYLSLDALCDGCSE